MPLPAGHGIAPRPGEAHRVTPSRPCTQGALHGTGPGCQPEPVYSDSTPPSPPGCLAVLPANHCLRCSPASQWGGSRSPRAALSPGWIFTPTNWPGLFMVGLSTTLTPTPGHTPACSPSPLPERLWGQVPVPSAGTDPPGCECQLSSLSVPSWAASFTRLGTSHREKVQNDSIWCWRREVGGGGQSAVCFGPSRYLCCVTHSDTVLLWQLK